MALKSSHHFRAGFESLASAIVTADPPGLTTQRLRDVPARAHATADLAARPGRSLPGGRRLARAARSTARRSSAVPAEYDAAVAADPDVDRFCSRSDWILSFHDAFHPRHASSSPRADGGAFVALAAAPGLLDPLEAMWALRVAAGRPRCWRAHARAAARDAAETRRSTSRVSRPRPRARRAAARAAARLRARPRLDHRALRRAARRPRRLPRAAQREVPTQRPRCGRGERARRASRSSTRARRRGGRRRGATRACSRSRGGAGSRQATTASTAGRCASSTRRMFPRLAARGALRVVFATRGGEDVGYLAAGSRASCSAACSSASTSGCARWVWATRSSSR